MVADQSQDTYMSLHVLQALVEIGEHVGKLIRTDEVGSTRSVQPAGHGFEVGVVLEVVVHVFGQIGDATLFGDEGLALSVESSRLVVNGFERVGQGGQDSQGVVGALD
jgi:hypothetical protein